MGKIRFCLVVLLFALIGNAKGIVPTPPAPKDAACLPAICGQLLPSATSDQHRLISFRSLVCADVSEAQNSISPSGKDFSIEKDLSVACHRQRLNGLRNTPFTRVAIPHPDRVEYYVYSLRRILI